MAMALACLIPSAAGVILLGSGDPQANTTAPAGDLAGSGWQYQGQLGDAIGTAIAPGFFITAKHVATAGSAFRFHGVDYPLVRRIDDPRSDLTIWQVGGTLPAYAPLYPRDDELGQRFVVIGRGTRRGDDVIVDGQLRGWRWSADDHVQRWGENVAQKIYSGGPGTEYLYAAFDAIGGSNEAHLSRGDSGGAIFLKDKGVWKLAGISYAVEGPFYSAMAVETRIDGALFDSSGLYRSNDGLHFQLVQTGSAAPTGFYATRISSKRTWIHSVIDPAGDGDRDGISNLLEYAFHLDPERADTTGLPEFRIEDGVPTLVYRTLTYASELRYAIEKSRDLKTWEPAEATEEYLDWEDYVETYKATVAPSADGPVYLRVVVSRL